MTTVIGSPSARRARHDERPEPPAPVGRTTAEPPRPARAEPPARWLVEPVRPDDRPALVALFGQCSPETVRLRFFGRLNALPREYLDGALAGRSEVHDAVVAARRDPYGDGGRTLAGLASLAVGPDDDHGRCPRTAELGLLVADAWQGQGVGGAMLGLLLSRARARGVEQVTATVLPGRSGLLAALERRPELEPAGRSRTRDGLAGVYRLSRRA